MALLHLNMILLGPVVLNLSGSYVQFVNIKVVLNIIFSLFSLHSNKQFNITKDMTEINEMKDEILQQHRYSVKS
jgi:hypothetical protein